MCWTIRNSGRNSRSKTFSAGFPRRDWLRIPFRFLSEASAAVRSVSRNGSNSEHFFTNARKGIVKSMDFTIPFRALVKKSSEFEPFLETDRTAADASERNRKGIRNQSRLGKTLENVFNREFRSEFRIV